MSKNSKAREDRLVDRKTGRHSGRATDASFLLEFSYQLDFVFRLFFAGTKEHNPQSHSGTRKEKADSEEGVS